MSVSVEIKDNTAHVKDVLSEAIITSLEMVGIAVQGEAEEEISRPKMHADGEMRPNVVTNRLRSSITHEIDEDRKVLRVGTNVEYAPYLEFGTRRMPSGYPFLKPALEKKLADGTVMRAFQMALSNATKG